MEKLSGYSNHAYLVMLALGFESLVEVSANRVDPYCRQGSVVEGLPEHRRSSLRYMPGSVRASRIHDGWVKAGICCYLAYGIETAEIS